MRAQRSSWLRAAAAAAITLACARGETQGGQPPMPSKSTPKPPSAGSAKAPSEAAAAPASSPGAGSAATPAGSAAPAAKLDCKAHLRTLFHDGDLSSGAGLPDGCLLADTDAAFGDKHSDGPGRRGTFREYRIAQQEHTVRVFHNRDRVSLVDLGYPKLRQRPDALLAALGKPSAELVAHMGWQESVYLDRGLTIAITEDGKRKQVSHLFAYAPTTMDDYVDRLGGKDDWVRKFPRR